LPSDYTDEDLVARWEEFFESSGQRVKVIEVTDLYPEQRSVFITYAELDVFDPDMADYILNHPMRSLHLGKQAMRKIVPPGREKTEVNLRIKGLPKDSKIEIRRIRAEHLGKLIAVEGLVRKATEVRPKVTDALFQCMRCDHVVREPQEGMYFKEPLECYKDQGGCGKTASSTKPALSDRSTQSVISSARRGRKPSIGASWPCPSNRSMPDIMAIALAHRTTARPASRAKSLHDDHRPPISALSVVPPRRSPARQT